MAIEKLLEFAKDGQKNTDDLNLTDGFPVSKKPARQWFNWLFNSLTSKVNEIIDAEFIPKAEIVDNLTTNDATKPVSAKQAKNLQDNKLDKDDVLQFMPIAYPKSTPPSGYLAMMGQAISQVTYPKLYALYGANLPDMRAYTIRGLDNGRGIDLNRVVLTEQGDAIRNITGRSAGIHLSQFVVSGGTGALALVSSGEGGTGAATNGVIRSAIELDASKVVPTAPENRVKNIAFLYIVKAG